MQRFHESIANTRENRLRKPETISRISPHKIEFARGYRATYEQLPSLYRFLVSVSITFKWQRFQLCISHSTLYAIAVSSSTKMGTINNHKTFHEKTSCNFIGSSIRYVNVIRVNKIVDDRLRGLDRAANDRKEEAATRLRSMFLANYVQWFMLDPAALVRPP